MLAVPEFLNPVLVRKGVAKPFDDLPVEALRRLFVPLDEFLRAYSASVTVVSVAGGLAFTGYGFSALVTLDEGARLR
jgi:hypothetical protein